MNVLKKTLVAAGIATTVLATGAAQAATVSNPSTGTAFSATVVNQEDNSALDINAASIAGNGEWTLTLLAAEALSIDDSVTLTLDNGATWAAIASADLEDDGAAGSFSLANNADPAVAVFRVTTAVAAGSLITLAATATMNASAVPASGAVTISAEMKGFVGGDATVLYGSPLISNSLQTAPIYSVAAITPTERTIDVAEGFTLVLDANGANPSVTTDNVRPAITRNAAGANAGTALAAVLYSVAGDMTGVTSITCQNMTGSSATGVTTGGVANECLIDTATNMAHAVNTGALNGTLNVNTNVTFDGTTSLENRTFTLAVAGLADATAGYSASTPQAATAGIVLTRNGSSFTSNSLGALNKVTITDRSGAIGTGGADGAVAITGYDNAGTAVPCTGLMVSDVPNNGTVVIQGADIQSACVGAKRIEGVVNSTNILVSNVKTSADGVTVQSGTNSASTIAN